MIHHIMYCFHQNFSEKGALYDSLHPLRIVVGVLESFNQKGKDERFTEIFFRLFLRGLCE